MKNNKVNTASNNSTKHPQPTHASKEGREKDLGFKKSLTSSDITEAKKTQPTSSLSGAADKSKNNK